MYEWLNNVVALFPDLVVCKSLVFSERLLSPGVHVRMQSNPKSKLVMFQDIAQVKSADSTKFYSGFGVWGRPRRDEVWLQLK